MGNCAGICNQKFLKYKGDVILISQNQETGNYLEQNNLKKIIYLQNAIRKYLKGIKNKKKLTILKNISHNNSIQLQSEKDLKISKDWQVKSNKNTNTKSSKNKSKYIAYDEEPTTNEFLIPTITTPLLEKKIFNGDPFRKKECRNKSINSENKNDPRDGPIDGIRRKFPKIQENQTSYEGEWKDEKRDGYGILSWNEDCKFIGKFENDKIIEYGKLWNKEGDMYKGFWKEFQAEGIGIYQNKKGSTYKGEWKNDRQNGFGMEKWPKGSNFMGEYYEGFKNGIGILSFGNKAGYKGEFKDGVITGIGTFYFEDMRKYEGQWKNNKMDGYGILIWPGGDVFEGEFKEDKKCGFGVFYNQNKIYMGNWKRNKPEGDVIIIDGDKIKRQFWENGRPVRLLDKNYKTAFEKYADIIRKEQRKKKRIED